MLTHVSAVDNEGKKTYTFNSQYKVEVPRRYEVSSMVGRGAYGIVCSAVDNTTGDTVAIKKISNIFEDVVDGKRILREIKLLGFLKHPNILSLKDLFRPSGSGFSDIYVVTELMSSDLQAVLRSSSLSLTDEHCRYFTYQLLCALRYLHSADVIHRDLKPANLLMNAECDLKLCDFGLARGKAPKMTHYVVTRWYRPPELLLMCDEYDGAVDLWGVACLALEMFTRRPLFPGRDYLHQLTLITGLLGLPDLARDLPHVRSPDVSNYLRSLAPAGRRALEDAVPDVRDRYRAAFLLSVESCEAGDSASEEGGRGADAASSEATAALGDERYRQFTDFLFRLLTYNPEKRMTASEALNHPWLQDLHANWGSDAETEASERFFWEFDSAELSAGQIRQLVLNEVIKYNS